MHNVLQPTMIVLVFVLLRATDLAIVAGIARDSIRALCYGLVAALALVAVVLALIA